ncbi:MULTISPECIES: hypothetical protein [Facklamia]|uniref:V-type proton ATPase subunit E n=1 Tax=Facklamia hominis CCUG 36813 TaxID=883111 RepID=K1LEH6_9LACT|nr:MULTISPECIES: hypothetical protein [Facklamia]EKB55035.1 hypothetical protein HMPREF9706_01225 [Facklamia hominis CCUG 36813]EPH08727.1 hypothetical protein HMPREF9260_01460 [Facklamia hominis ACS-120-V-Sch10]OFL67543.1 hypothetical protein HMPREF2758_05945 [Facklamia sp. HMSC062C11]RYC98277.1 hypothetical protein EKN08_03535 [Facklamia hominis]WPJ90715.1 hypothetical protein R0V13_09680 [Facklamia hominis]
MGKIETLQQSILDKVQATGEAKVQALQSELADKLAQFKTRLSDQVNQQKDSFNRSQARQFEIRQQSLTNELRNDQLTHKQALLKEMIQGVAPLVNQQDEEEFVKLIRHVLKDINESQSFKLTLGQKSSDKLSQESRAALLKDYPNMEITEANEAGKSGFMLSQAGINLNYFFEDVIQELTPQLLIELEKLLQA